MQTEDMKKRRMVDSASQDPINSTTESRHQNAARLLATYLSNPPPGSVVSGGRVLALPKSAVDEIVRVMDGEELPPDDYVFDPDAPYEPDTPLDMTAEDKRRVMNSGYLGGLIKPITHKLRTFNGWYISVRDQDTYGVTLTGTAVYRLYGAARQRHEFVVILENHPYITEPHLLYPAGESWAFDHLSNVEESLFTEILPELSDPKVSGMYVSDQIAIMFKNEEKQPYYLTEEARHVVTSGPDLYMEDTYFGAGGDIRVEDNHLFFRNRVFTATSVHQISAVYDYKYGGFATMWLGDSVHGYLGESDMPEADRTKAFLEHHIMTWFDFNACILYRTGRNQKVFFAVLSEGDHRLNEDVAHHFENPSTRHAREITDVFACMENRDGSFIYADTGHFVLGRLGLYVTPKNDQPPEAMYVTDKTVADWNMFNPQDLDAAILLRYKFTGDPPYTYTVLRRDINGSKTYQHKYDALTLPKYDAKAGTPPGSAVLYLIKKGPVGQYVRIYKDIEVSPFMFPLFTSFRMTPLVDWKEGTVTLRTGHNAMDIEYNEGHAKFNFRGFKYVEIWRMHTRLFGVSATPSLTHVLVVVGCQVHGFTLHTDGYDSNTNLPEVKSSGDMDDPLKRELWDMINARYMTFGLPLRLEQDLKRTLGGGNPKYANPLTDHDEATTMHLIVMRSDGKDNSLNMMIRRLYTAGGDPWADMKYWRHWVAFAEGPSN